ncbi:cell division protein FtsQ/DivIB [Caenibacillus caldisaponilyticus]|uniref:cell division protein FtsQ/DivIB n=1 Tax=Caenibacillus caldisaponilyticus TaxID=1674942 RepID=UPI00098894B5|nr:FtsQ-type POTRA domain-containing protein [Caenibacillus caldisaponilyticus]
MTDKKVVRLEDRIPKLKARRRQKANRRLIFYITVFFVLITAVIYLVSPVSNVRKIVVDGNHLVDERRITAASGVTTKSKIWDVDETRAAKRIEDLPEVKSAVVRTAYPSTVAIRVKEYRRVAYMKVGGAFYPVLENGRVLAAKEDRPQTNVPILNGFQQGKMLERLSGQLAKTPAAVVRATSEILPSDDPKHPDYVVIYMNNGQEVLADIDTLAKKMALYPSIAEVLKDDKKGKGVIDLTLGASWTPYPTENKGGSPSR